MGPDGQRGIKVRFLILFYKLIFDIRASVVVYIFHSHSVAFVN